MNLRTPNSNEATRTANRSKSVTPMSGICSRCIDGCTGNCEIFKATFRGREVIYPGPFGTIIAGGDKDYPVDYSHLNIQGYALGAEGLPDGVVGNPDTATFPVVNTETEYGWDKKVRMKLPVFTGAMGSTEIARRNWEHFAIGAALSGITLVCGENVCGIDPQLEVNANGKVTSSPDMDRRIETYRRYHQGYGEILVQMNVEDTRLGVAEYVSQFGSTPEEIFINYEDVKNIVGGDEIKHIPLGAIGVYSYCDRIRVGLQQIMAGARCFSLSAITRREVMSLTEECAKVTNIPYLMDAYREEAMAILES